MLFNCLNKHGRGLAICCFLAACDVPATPALPVSARFTEFPTILFTAFEAACSSPTERFVRRGRNVVECRILPPPDVAAAIILNYDGDLKAPELVLQLTAVPDGTGYITQHRDYLNVPQKTGPALQVVRPSAAMDAKMKALFAAAGGVPL